MKQWILIFGLAAFTPAFASAAAETTANPWAEHYAQQQELAKALSVELPDAPNARVGKRNTASVKKAVSAGGIEKAIASALERDGAGEQLTISLSESQRQSPIFSPSSSMTFEVGEVTYNARELSWNATVYPFENQHPLASVKLMGSYDEVAEVPVLARRIRRDEVITPADVVWQKIDATRLRADTALQAGNLIGMTPRRTISPGRSVRLAELVKPAVIRKNDQVTLQFRSGIMEIRTLGEAMEDGAKGDIIRIRNKDSHQPVQARILAAGLAEAMPIGALAQAEEIR